MTDKSLRGEGLMKAHRALTFLAEDQHRLDDGLMRFGNSPPPPYSAPQSHNSTRSQSPDLGSDEQRRREERKWQLIIERRASRPYEQLSAQEIKEEEWLVQADRNGTHPLPCRVGFDKLAHDNVKKRWVEQGIWHEKWTSTASNGVWKHEEPLELESELETDDEREPQPGIFTASLMPRPPKSDEEKQRIIEQRSRRLRELETSRQASRPFHQFVYQVSHQRGRIEDTLGNAEARAAASPNADINTRAYEMVKSFWVKQKIWDQRWGILPGMSWKHEEPLEEEVSAPAQTNPVEVCKPEVVGGRLERPFLFYAPVETSQHQASSALDTSQQRRPSNEESAGLADTDTEHPFPEPNSHRPRNGVQISQPAMRRIAQHEAFHENGQIQPAASPSLGHIHTSKASTVPKKKTSGRRQQQLDASETDVLDDLSVPAEPDLAETTPSATAAHPRRSDRLKSLELTVAPKSELIATANSLQGTTRTSPKRNARSNLNMRRVGKPQGISKKRRSPRRKA